MSLIPATCELWIDGFRYADGQPSEDPAEPVALSGLTIRWGRSNTVDQPSPASCSFEIADAEGGSQRFDDTIKLGSAVVIWSELDGQRTVVFGGRVTDLEASYDDDLGAARCSVVAMDQLSELANRYVGSEPWASQLMWERAARILGAVGLDWHTSLASIPNRPANLVVSRVDVDRQAATDLLQELAISSGSVLWGATDPATGVPYLIYEDPANRSSLYVFAENLATLLWAPSTGSGAGTPLSSCEVLRDPVQWSRAVTDLITRVTVRWLDQSTSPGTTERSVGLTDAGAEANYGSRGISIGTILTKEIDAQNLAAGTLAAHQPSPAWRADGLTWDLSQVTTDSAAHRTLVRTLLDNKARLGYAIALIDLPYWTPTSAAVQLYIEGGTYRYAEGGYWILALEASPATGLGGSLTYGQTDRSIRYADVDPGVSFLEMIGVGPAGPTGPDWADIPTATTWATVPAGKRWADDPR